MRSKMLSVFVVALVLGTQVGVAIDAEQRKLLKKLTEDTKTAGTAFAKGELLKSAELITKTQADFIKLMKSGDASVHRLGKGLYTRLTKAHSLLELEGAELEPLPEWSELIKPTAEPEPMSADQVSFVKAVAPWMVSACGRCHADRSSGGFSLATYDALMKGTAAGAVLFPSSSRGNRLVEVFESGDMPRGGGKVTPEQLTSLKKWIEQGAKFDGPDKAARLTSFASDAPDNAPRMPRTQVTRATGSESVSYARDVAPILKDNCFGCHIGGRRASGNLRMDTFAQLLRGGDSGEIVEAKNADGSLLVQKLRGEAGNRMPAGGRPPLSSEQIQLISTWIKEGAKFDGPTPNTNIDTVVNQAWAEGATHEELFARRQKQALAKWKQVMPNDAPESVASEEVFVLGNVTERQLEKTLTQVNAAVKEARDMLPSTPKNESLIRGGLAVFVLKSRYDYSEFGRMTENRELPKDWLGHWHADPIDVYVVLPGDSALEEKQAQAVALQVVSAAYLGSFQGVPNWFAEGVARNLVYRGYRRHDDRVKAWQAALPAASRQVQNAKSVTEGRLDEEVSGLVGMSLTSFMMDRTNKKRFDKLLQLLSKSQPFDKALTMTYAPPEALVKTWLGK